MINSNVYCVISVCSCFVIILKFYNFRYRFVKRREKTGEVVVWQEAALPTCYMPRKNYQPEQATPATEGL